MDAIVVFWLAWTLGAAAWLVAEPRVRGLTLRGPWVWGGVAWTALAACEGFIQNNIDSYGEPDWASAMRFVAAIGMFCPVMSVLGAKRPQDQAWHFIVLSLWVMLALPSAEVLVLHPGQQLEIHDARAWFLAALIFVSAAHLLATRYWLSGIAFGAGLVLLLGPHLPWHPLWLDSAPAIRCAFTGGTCLIALAACLAWRPKRVPANSRWDRLWFDFRNSYGMLWSLRVAQRVNDAAATSNWPVVLQWDGFFSPDGEPLDEPADSWRQGFEHCLRGLLRRFVSSDWIAERLGEAPNNHGDSSSAEGDTSKRSADSTE